MMMLEKAIKLLKQYQGYDPMFPDGETLKHAFDLTDETVDTLLTALRPVSREMVEKVWGFGGWETVPDQGFVDTMGRQVYHLHCHHCGFFWREKGHAKYFKFCPACGAPMTDEAMEMVIERLNAIR